MERRSKKMQGAHISFCPSPAQVPFLLFQRKNPASSFSPWQNTSLKGRPRGTASPGPLDFVVRTLLCFVLVLFLTGSSLHAKCTGSFVNVLTDIAWETAFPIKIGGVTIVHSSSYLGDSEDNISHPLCRCGEPPNVRYGLLVSFWEPIYIVDTVTEPGCFPSLGIDVNVPGKNRMKGGETPRSKPGQLTFYWAHLIKFPVWVGLDLLTDLPCWSEGKEEFLDIAYMTELDPLWSDDILTMMLHPEVLVFASLPGQLACIPDSVKSAAKSPIDELFWCVGDWGSAYPLSGSAGENDPLTSSALVTSRLIYKLTREMLVPDAATNECGYVRPLIWKKSHWRIQLMRPERASTATPLGRTSLRKWGWEVNRPDKPLNFSWIVWRKHVCCASFFALPF